MYNEKFMLLSILFVGIWYETSANTYPKQSEKLESYSCRDYKMDLTLLRLVSSEIQEFQRSRRYIDNKLFRRGMVTMKTIVRDIRNVPINKRWTQKGTILNSTLCAEVMAKRINAFYRLLGLKAQEKKLDEMLAKVEKERQPDTTVNEQIEKLDKILADLKENKPVDIGEMQAKVDAEKKKFEGKEKLIERFVKCQPPDESKMKKIEVPDHEVTTDTEALSTSGLEKLATAATGFIIPKGTKKIYILGFLYTADPGDATYLQDLAAAQKLCNGKLECKSTSDLSAYTFVQYTQSETPDLFNAEKDLDFTFPYGPSIPFCYNDFHQIINDHVTMTRKNIKFSTSTTVEIFESAAFSSFERNLALASGNPNFPKMGVNELFSHSVKYEDLPRSMKVKLIGMYARLLGKDITDTSMVISVYTYHYILHTGVVEGKQFKNNCTGINQGHFYKAGNYYNVQVFKLDSSYFIRYGDSILPDAVDCGALSVTTTTNLPVKKYLPNCENAIESTIWISGTIA
ncbi:hypothetical protein SNEBB_006041 [Seison nebaliae]|nr:hypothetical protein SNEBB_006041 [Seison nebaliae]